VRSAKSAIGVLVVFALAPVAPGADFGDLREIIHFHSKTHFTPPYYARLTEWKARSTELRRQVLVSAGLWPLEKRGAVNARRLGRQNMGDYVVEKVAYESMPGFWVGANLYLPAHQTERAPAVLVAHGHWKGGRTHNADDYSVPAICANLAAQGFVVFAWDMVGYNDTRQLPHVFGSSAEEQDWAFTPLGVQLWNSIRALDFVAGLAEVDAARIGMTGTSGGGTQTYLLAAVDERIRAAAPGGMVSSIFQGDDPCEMAPGLRVGTNNVELAALMAPRPLLLVSATGDWTKNTPRVELPAIRSIYGLYGQARNASAAHIKAGHNCNRESREAIYAFFRRVLNPSAKGGTSERAEVRLPMADQLLLGAEMPAGNGGEAEVLDTWRRMAQARTERMETQELVTRLTARLGVKQPRQVTVLEAGDKMLLMRAGSGERVPAQWVVPPDTGAGPVDVVVDAEGLNCSRCRQTALSPGGALLVEVYHASRPATAGYDLERLTFHRSEEAERVQDILTAVTYARRFAGTRPVRLNCRDRAASWCVLAAALAPSRLSLELGDATRDRGEHELGQNVRVTGLKWTGGVPVLRTAIAAQRPNARVSTEVQGYSPLE